jgi:hypothetical protein
MSAAMVTPFLFAPWESLQLKAIWIARDGPFLCYDSFLQHLHVLEISLLAGICLLISPCNALDVQQRQDNLMDSAG